MPNLRDKLERRRLTDVSLLGHLPQKLHLKIVPFRYKNLLLNQLISSLRGKKLERQQ